MAEAAAAHDDHHHDPKEHERHYVKIWGILLVLLIVSVAGVEVQDLIGLEQGTLTRLVVTLIMAFGIALWKAYYVVKEFMHLTLEPKYVGYLCGTALVFMGLFFFFVAPDVMKHDGANWENLAAKKVAGQPTEFGPKPIREAPPIVVAEEDADEEDEDEQEGATEAAEAAEADADGGVAAEVAEASEAADAGIAPGPGLTPEGITEGEARKRGSFIRGQLLTTR